MDVVSWLILLGVLVFVVWVLTVTESAARRYVTRRRSEK